MIKNLKALMASVCLSLMVTVQTARLQNLQVKINNADDFCLVVPKNAHTNIGDSEYPGGETVWCQGNRTPGATGNFDGRFWRNVQVSTPKSGVIQVSERASSSSRIRSFKAKAKFGNCTSYLKKR